MTTLAAGTTLQVVADFITIRTTPDQNAGAYLLFTSRTQPGGGIPPHRHAQEDESFYVLRGVYSFMLNGEQHTLRAGESLFVPRGAVHAFQNIGDGEAELLIVTSPGRLHEAFFADLGIVLDPAAPAQHAPPPVPVIVATAARHGIEMLPPQG
jgi:quercetin dioxygenase-like cupin family protein